VEKSLVEFLRTFWLLWLMLLFIGIVAWVYWPSRRRKKSFEETARIPLEDDDPSKRPNGKG
jgi:cytochrome c oxidase cbb3-type subunit 4